MSGYIPKTLVQTSKTALDPYLSAMIREQLTEGWTYEHYTDSDILEFFRTHPLEEFSAISDVFTRLQRGEHKADLFRYYYLYVKGGVYMDSDAMIYRPIDSIVKDYTFISVESSIVAGALFQGILGAIPGHPILYKALQTFYSMDIAALAQDYHAICKQLYTLYKEYTSTVIRRCILYTEIADTFGDRIVDTSGNVLFRHYWRAKESIPNSIQYRLLEKPGKRRHLVYACVFYNADYFKLARLLLLSMQRYSTLDFDICIMTHEMYLPHVQRICNELQLHCIIFTRPFTTIFQAACARLHIFEMPSIDTYTRVLYLDTDIIIKGDIAPLFALELEESVYGLECGTISSPSFGNQFFDFSSISGTTPGINSGTLLFKNSTKVRDLFCRIQAHIADYTASGKAVPYCMDQPFINYHTIRDGMCNKELLKPYISLYEGNEEVDNYETSSICHFSYPIGNFGHKYARMVKFFTGLLGQVTHAPVSDIPAIVGKSYSWNSGTIQFLESSLLTTWGAGRWECVEGGVKVYWNGHYHVLRFDSSCASFVSIRTWPSDCDVVRGWSKESA